jgi:hypothetical protein
LDKKEKLLDLGFTYNPRPKFTYESVKIAVLIFRGLYHISVDIPDVYNIPINDVYYPKDTWGMSLGRLVHYFIFIYMYVCLYV